MPTRLGWGENWKQHSTTQDKEISQFFVNLKPVGVPFPDTGRDTKAWESATSVLPSMQTALLEVLGIPLHWPPPIAPMGVLHFAYPQTHGQPPEMLERGCTVWRRKDAKGSKPTSLMTELVISASFLRQYTSPPLLMALVTSPSTRRFIQSRAEINTLWDRIIDFDQDAAASRLIQLRERDANVVKLAGQAVPFLWKICALLLSPFQSTLYLDADTMVLEHSLAHNLLTRSLRLHHMALPVDVGRPGNRDPTYRRLHSRMGAAKLFQEAKEDSEANTPPQPLSAPMFAMGFPPVCSCVVAFTRHPKVRRLFMHAAMRLMGRLNPTDLTNASLGIRQTDQEMMWFEMATGNVDEQPSSHSASSRGVLLPKHGRQPAVPGLS